MARMRGADIIAEYLIREKVPYVFGLCGHGNIGLLDGFYDRQDEIKVMTVRHEQAAGHMADAYFRVAHQPVATVTSCGPGSTNLLTALASAMMDSSAVLAITGNVPTSQFNRAPFQETGRHFQAEFPNVIRPYVKKSFQPTRVEMIPLALRQAFKTMLTGRPGPVGIDVPLNCFAEEAEVHGARVGMSEQSLALACGAPARAHALLQSRLPLLLSSHASLAYEPLLRIEFGRA